MQIMNIVAAIVGMAGSGKSEAARTFEKRGFTRIRFGDITDIEMKKRGLKGGEADERYCREILRKEHGMAAYAILNRPRIDSALQQTNVVADGLYSWEEYLDFKKYYADRFLVVAVTASPTTRYQRLSCRSERSLTRQECVSRDISEIENLNKGGPIAMADFTLVNESSVVQLQRQADEIVNRLLLARNQVLR
jgi:dephospho-CoA kinase